MINRRKEDTRIKGTIAEHKFIVECAKAGIEICRPVIQSPRYDFIINAKGGWKRVQIKYISGKDGKIPVSKTKQQNGRTSTLTYTTNDIDLLFVYNPDTDFWYDIPFNDFGRVIILRYIPSKMEIKTIKKAADYILNFSSL